MNADFATAVFFGIIGSMVGSFLNVCIYRLPKGQSIVMPRSHCTECETPIRFYDNIPVVSYLLLRGKCRNCRASISLQYPLVEASCAALVVAAYLGSDSMALFMIDAVFLVLLFGIAVVDARTYTIPDTFTIGGILLGLAFSFLPGDLNPLESLIGMLVGGLTLYIVGLLGEVIMRRETMGGGDVKMIAMLGAFIGLPGVFFSIFVGSLLGSLIFGWINYVMRKEKLVPFGIFLALGAGLYVFFGQILIEWYLGFFSSQAIDFFFSE
jgi:leader peptidase (prepilin peptidase) / N-methyltransferase